jgi:ABC-type antimicrobial peptide transport system permease subunit
MINFKDSFKLAKIKFKTRKGRSIFSSLVVSMSILVIMTVMLAVTGVLDLGSKAFKNSNSDRFLAVEQFFASSDQNLQDADLQKKTPKSISEYKDQIKKFGPKDIYAVDKTQDKFLFVQNDTEIENNDILINNGLQMVQSPDFLVQDYIYQDYSFEDEYDGKIPVIMPRNYLFFLEAVKDIEDSPLSILGYMSIANNIMESDGREGLYNKFQELIPEYLGKTYRLKWLDFATITGQNGIDPVPSRESFNSKDTEVEIIVVGFNADFPLNRSPLQDSIIIPNWAMEDKEVEKLFDDKIINYLVEFESQADLESFASSNIFLGMGSKYQLRSAFDIFAEPIRIAQNVFFVIGGVLLAVSSILVATTISKIASDSKREIGVFRAIGAQKRDIKKIFFSFTFLIVLAGFIMGLILAVLVVVLLSVFFGDDAFYSIAILGNSLDYGKPAFVFLGFPAGGVLILFSICILAGMLGGFIPVTRASRTDPINALREG